MIRPNAALLLIIAAYTLCVLVLGRIFKFDVHLGIYGEPLYVLVPGSLMLALLFACLTVLLKHRPPRPIAFIRNRIALDWKIGERALLGLPVFFAMSIMFSAFTSFKLAISRIVLFYADPYAAALDRLLHGTDPWRLLHPLVGFPIATTAINFLYNLWFFVMYVVLALAIFGVSGQSLRTRYLVTFLLSWAIIGSLFATLLSSVGPCYYELFYDTTPFADLIAYLDDARQTHPVWARDTQAMLFNKNRLQEAGFGAGISALPSMHIAIVVLNAVFLGKLHRLAGWAAWLYAAIIFIGSVHLGWHYAIDGYVAALLVLAIWKASGLLCGTPDADGAARGGENKLDALLGGVEGVSTRGVSAATEYEGPKMTGRLRVFDVKP